VLFLLIGCVSPIPADLCLETAGQHRGDEFRIYDVAWSPTADLLFTGSMTRLRLHAIEDDGDTVVLLDEEESTTRYNSVLWTADGGHLIAPSGDAIRLYAVDPVAGFDEIARSPATGVEYNRAALSPDGRHLLACDRDGRAELHALSLDPPQLVLLDRVQAHERCTRISWSPGGTMGMSAGLEGDLQLYAFDIEAGSLSIRDTLSFPEETADGIWTSDDRWAVAGSFGVPFELWYLRVDPDTQTFSIVQTRLDHASGVSALALDANSDTLLTGGHNHTMHLYAHVPGVGLELRYDHPDDGVGVHSARFSRDERYVARTASTIDRLDILRVEPSCLAP
jgi:WD40 repeat protein